jgi:protein HIRA/HIR1
MMEQAQAHDGYVSSSMDDSMMGGGLPTIDAYGPDWVGMSGKGRRKTREMDVDGPRGRARTLGGDRVGGR